MKLVALLIIVQEGVLNHGPADVLVGGQKAISSKPNTAVCNEKKQISSSFFLP